MARRISEEVRIMDTLRGLDPAKREVVMNLALAEFRARPVKKRAPAKARAASVKGLPPDNDIMPV